MPNYENIKDKGFDTRTTSERRELAKNAGIASGKARKEKATLRKIAKGLIDGDAMTDLIMALQAAAIDPDNNHQIAAFKELMGLLEEDRTAADKREQKARIAKLEAEAKAARIRLEEDSHEENLDEKALRMGRRALARIAADRQRSDRRAAVRQRGRRISVDQPLRSLGGRRRLRDSGCERCARNGPRADRRRPLRGSQRM